MTATPDDDVYFRKDDYGVFQAFLQSACGIVLGDNKQYLVANRIRRILEEQQVATLTALVRRMEQDPRCGLRERVINAMTTNETFWFRDNFPFEILRDTLLPRLLLQERRESLRFWSAACSSGQEPYSISMIIEEFKSRHPGVIRREPTIVGTDISSKVLMAAREARYDSLSINRGLSEQRRQLFFKLCADGSFQLHPQIAARVEFRTLNLLDSYALLGSFDVVFCRNVLIYFSADMKIDILRRMRATLKPGSSLILGASESMPAAVSSLYVAERTGTGQTIYTVPAR